MALGVKEPSLLSTAYKYGVPIFVGAVQDGSIFLNIVKLKRLLGESFKLEIDVCDDVFEMGAMQHHCFSTLNHNLGYCYNDARVIKWVWKQMVTNRMKGGARSFED